MSFPDIVILAGGLGTRLKTELGSLPKAMAPINGKPFLEYLLDYINIAGFQRVILSTGYQSESIESFFKEQYRSIEIEYSKEAEPLGTGGAIKLAAKKVTTPYFIVMNGDTMFRIDLQKFFQEHVEQLAEVTLALRKVQDASRFGIIECTDSGIIKSFREKSETHEEGLINGGIYILKTKFFKKQNLPKQFSFEKDWLQKNYQTGVIRGQLFNDYFLDIGIPEDYKRAHSEFHAFKD